MNPQLPLRSAWDFLQEQQKKKRNNKNDDSDPETNYYFGVIGKIRGLPKIQLYESLLWTMTELNMSRDDIILSFHVLPLLKDPIE